MLTIYRDLLKGFYGKEYTDVRFIHSKINNGEILIFDNYRELEEYVLEILVECGDISEGMLYYIDIEKYVHDCSMDGSFEIHEGKEKVYLIY